MRLTALVPLAALATPVAAFDLAFPVDCRLGETCYLQNLFDHAPGPEAQDAGCGTLAYDGHTGTDIALPTLADQARGVNVLAAAAGRVVATRDGMEDRLQGAPDSPDIAGRECGNGLLISHDGGWETQYCHMAKGSIQVKQGDEVQVGQVLGQLGLSGATEFPHLEITVRANSTPLDPFAPDAPGTCGPLPENTLWATPVAFPQGGLTDVGFATDVPDYADIRAGTADTPPAPDQPLVVFGLIYGGREGDEVRLSIEAPDGSEAFAHSEALDRTQALLFRAAGRRPPDGGWPPGTYRGTVALVRDGQEVGRLSLHAEMR